MTNKSRTVIDRGDEMDGTTIIVPQGTPLFATTKDAARLFGIGRTKLFEMRRDIPEFRALTLKTGKTVLYDIPRTYQWLQRFCGGELE
jgi:hypothetical protein